MRGTITRLDEHTAPLSPRLGRDPPARPRIHGRPRRARLRAHRPRNAGRHRPVGRGDRPTPATSRATGPTPPSPAPANRSRSSSSTNPPALEAGREDIAPAPSTEPSRRPARADGPADARTRRRRPRPRTTRTTKPLDGTSNARRSASRAPTSTGRTADDRADALRLAAPRAALRARARARTPSTTQRDDAADPAKPNGHRPAQGHDRAHRGRAADATAGPTACGTSPPTDGANTNASSASNSYRDTASRTPRRAPDPQAVLDRAEQLASASGRSPANATRLRDQAIAEELAAEPPWLEHTLGPEPPEDRIDARRLARDRPRDRRPPHRPPHHRPPHRPRPPSASALPARAISETRVALGLDTPDRGHDIGYEM